MKVTELKVGAIYWWYKGWRYIWYTGKNKSRYIFEDAGDKRISLTEEEVVKLERR